MKQEQFDLIKKQLGRLAAVDGGFYQKKFRDFDVTSIQSQEDFEKLPFTNKDELREAYPLGLQAGAG